MLGENYGNYGKRNKLPIVIGLAVCIIFLLVDVILFAVEVKKTANGSQNNAATNNTASSTSKGSSSSTSSNVVNTSQGKIYLADMEALTEDRVYSADKKGYSILESNYGDIYSSCIYADYHDGYIRYALDQQYDTFSGTVYVTKEGRGYEESLGYWEDASILVFGDDMLLGEWHDLSPKTKPIDFEINTKGIYDLKIYMSYAYRKSDSILAIAEPALSNEGQTQYASGPYMLEMMEYFSENNTDLTVSRGIDKYNQTFQTRIAQAYSGYFNTPEEGYIEYNIRREYKTLDFYLYIPRDVAAVTKLKSSEVASGVINIYGDDVLLASYSGFSLNDTARACSVDVSGVEFLKIEFIKCAIDAGDTYRFVKIAEAKLWK